MERQGLKYIKAKVEIKVEGKEEPKIAKYLSLAST